MLVQFIIPRRRLCAVFVLVLASLYLSPITLAATGDTENVLRLLFEWEYDTGTPGLTGYIIYQNGRSIAAIDEPATLSADLEVVPEPGRTNLFTMSAVFENGEESAISAPYPLEIPAAAPLQPPGNLRIIAP